MKKFDFRRTIKDLNLEQLQSQKSYYTDLMLGAMGFDDKEADKYFRYIGYIEDRIAKLN